MSPARPTVEYRRDIPVARPVDVLVCGGGPSGVAAALSARRAGARVLLVEAMGQLGGMGTSGLVSHWLGGRTSDCRRWVVGGLFRSLAEAAEHRGFALLPKQEPGGRLSPHGWGRGQLTAGVPFDPFVMAAFLDEKVAGAGIGVLLLTRAVDVLVDGARIGHMVVSNKSGLTAVPARAVVDATGDADIAARAGCEVKTGRDEDGLMTPATLEFHVDSVDQDAVAKYIHENGAPRFRALIRDLRKRGAWPFPYDIFISVQLSEKGVMMINTPRLVGIDGTDGASVTEGMVRGRREILQLLAIMREHIPGFARARLKAVAPLLGVRETRRIVGEYVLTVNDLVSGRAADDAVGFSAYGWDLPDPKRPSHQPMHEKRVRTRSPYTPIPYGILVPRLIENLICPGRAVSVERDVLGPLRVSAPCFAMGEAAGQAAALAVQRGAAFRDVDTRRLRDVLRTHGAIVDPPR